MVERVGYRWGLGRHESGEFRLEDLVNVFCDEVNGSGVFGGVELGFASDFPDGPQGEQWGCELGGLVGRGEE